MARKLNLNTDPLSSEQIKRIVKGNIDKAMQAIVNPYLDNKALVYLNRYLDIGLNPQFIVKNNWLQIRELIDISYDGSFLRYCRNLEVLNQIMENLFEVNSFYFQLGRNPFLTDKMIAKLMKISSESLKKQLSGNPAIASEHLEVLVNETATVRRKLARRKNLPENIAIQLSQDKMRDIGEILAARDDLSLQTASSLLLNSYQITQAGDVLDQLFQQDSRFGGVILKQPACGTRLREIIKHQGKLLSLSKLKQALAKEQLLNADLPDISRIKTGKKLAALYKSNPLLGSLIVKNPACTKLLLKTLLKDNFDITLNPKVHLEIMADSKSIEQYLPNGFDALCNLAKNTTSIALQNYFFHHHQNLSYLEELGNNVNISITLRIELLKNHVHNVLKFPQLPVEQVIAFLDEEIDEQPEYMIYYFKYVLKNYELSDEQKGLYLGKMAMGMIYYYKESEYQAWQAQLEKDPDDKKAMRLLNRELLSDDDIKSLALILRKSGSQVIQLTKQQADPALLDLLLGSK